MLALGTPGSYGICQTQPQAMVQYLDFGLPLQQAIEAPRARLTDGRAVLARSRASSPTSHDELRERGHDVEIGARLDDDGRRHAGRGDRSATGGFTGGGDPRRDGYCVPA